MFSKCAF
jgi:hypothetical protein